MKQTKRSTYVVTLILLCCSVVVQAAPQAPPRPNPADMKQYYDYTLTMDKIRRLAAVEKGLDALEKTDPQLAQSMQNDTSAGDLDQDVQRLQKYPQVLAIMKKNGFTPHEYVVSTMTYFQAATFVGFKKNGAYREYPAQAHKVVSDANLTFVEQHWDEIIKTMPSFLDDNGAQQ